MTLFVQCQDERLYFLATDILISSSRIKQERGLGPSSATKLPPFTYFPS